MAGMTAALGALGVAPDRISTEAFGPTAPITPGIAAAAALERRTRRRARRARARRLVQPQQPHRRVGPRVPNLLEFAEACDVPVQWSCRTGVCHTCETGLISGDVELQPDPLEPLDAGNHADLLLPASRSAHARPLTPYATGPKR